MCDIHGAEGMKQSAGRAVPVQQAIGMALAHDITEIRPGEFKGPSFRKGQILKEEDISHLQRLGKERLFVLEINDGEVHEDDAALMMATALMGNGVAIKGEPKEGKITIIAERDGLLKIERDALLKFNMLGDVMCATLHDNTLVKKGQTVAGTRAIPLVVKRDTVNRAVAIAEFVRRPRQARGVRGRGPEPITVTGTVEVKAVRKPRAGVVITGNEVYHGRIKDAFAPVITKKIEEIGGELVGVYYAPDDKSFIGERLRELLNAGADLLITTGGMSVDPDDVTRFAIRELGAFDVTYGAAVLPGAMFLVGYLEGRIGRMQHGESTSGSVSEMHIGGQPADYGLIPILGIPACGMYARTTIFDLILPRVLAGEKIGREEIAALGHGGLCLHCEVCRYPVCPFGKQ